MKATILFVLLGFRLLCLALVSWLLGLLLLQDWRELGEADLVSFGLAELLGFLVEFVQVELTNYVLLVRNDRDVEVLDFEPRYYETLTGLICLCA